MTGLKLLSFISPPLSPPIPFAVLALDQIKPLNDQHSYTNISVSRGGALCWADLGIQNVGLA